MGAVLGNTCTNLLLGMKDRTSEQVMEIQNLTQGIAMRPADLVSGYGAIPSTDPIRVINFYPHMDLGRRTASLAVTGPGGFDTTGPADGAWAYMYLVTDGTESNTYCMLSRDPNCPQGMASSITHILYLGCNRMKLAGGAYYFEHRILKSQYRTYFEESPSTGNLPLLVSGIAPKWTDVSLNGVVPPTGGPVGLTLRLTAYNTSAGNSLVGISPSRNFNDPTHYINNFGALVDMAIPAEMLSDTGNEFAYWSQNAGARVYAAYFDDPH